MSSLQIWKSGTDVNVRDGDGTVSFQGKKNPVPTYDGNGNVTRIDYANGSYKTFIYTGDLLTQIDFVRPGLTTIRKTLSYTNDVWTGTVETEI